MNIQSNPKSELKNFDGSKKTIQVASSNNLISDVELVRPIGTPNVHAYAAECRRISNLVALEDILVNNKNPVIIDLYGSKRTFTLLCYAIANLTKRHLVAPKSIAYLFAYDFFQSKDHSRYHEISHIKDTIVGLSAIKVAIIDLQNNNLEKAVSLACTVADSVMAGDRILLLNDVYEITGSTFTVLNNIVIDSLLQSNNISSIYWIGHLLSNNMYYQKGDMLGHASNDNVFFFPSIYAPMVYYRHNLVKFDYCHRQLTTEFSVLIFTNENSRPIALSNLVTFSQLQGVAHAYNNSNYAVSASTASLSNFNIASNMRSTLCYFKSGLPEAFYTVLNDDLHNFLNDMNIKNVQLSIIEGDNKIKCNSHIPMEQKAFAKGHTTMFQTALDMIKKHIDLIVGSISLVGSAAAALVALSGNFHRIAFSTLSFVLAPFIDEIPGLSIILDTIISPILEEVFVAKNPLPPWVGRLLILFAETIASVLVNPLGLTLTIPFHASMLLLDSIARSEKFSSTILQIVATLKIVLHAMVNALGYIPVYGYIAQIIAVVVIFCFGLVLRFGGSRTLAVCSQIERIVISIKDKLSDICNCSQKEKETCLQFDDFAIAMKTSYYRVSGSELLKAVHVNEETSAGKTKADDEKARVFSECEALRLVNTGLLKDKNDLIALLEAANSDITKLKIQNSEFEYTQKQLTEAIANKDAEFVRQSENNQRFIDDLRRKDIVITETQKTLNNLDNDYKKTQEALKQLDLNHKTLVENYNKLKLLKETNDKKLSELSTHKCPEVKSNQEFVILYDRCNELEKNAKEAVAKLTNHVCSPSQKFLDEYAKLENQLKNLQGKCQCAALTNQNKDLLNQIKQLKTGRKAKENHDACEARVNELKLTYEQALDKCVAEALCDHVCICAKCALNAEINCEFPVLPDLSDDDFLDVGTGVLRSSDALKPGELHENIIKLDDLVAKLDQNLRAMEFPPYNPIRNYMLSPSLLGIKDHPEYDRFKDPVYIFDLISKNELYLRDLVCIPRLTSKFVELQRIQEDARSFTPNPKNSMSIMDSTLAILNMHCSEAQDIMQLVWRVIAPTALTIQYLQAVEVSDQDKKAAIEVVTTKYNKARMLFSSAVKEFRKMLDGLFTSGSLKHDYDTMTVAQFLAYLRDERKFNKMKMSQYEEAFKEMKLEDDMLFTKALDKSYFTNKKIDMFTKKDENVLKNFYPEALDAHNNMHQEGCARSIANVPKPSVIAMTAASESIKDTFHTAQNNDLYLLREYADCKVLFLFAASTNTSQIDMWLNHAIKKHGQAKLFVVKASGDDSEIMLFEKGLFQGALDLDLERYDTAQSFDIIDEQLNLMQRFMGFKGSDFHNIMKKVFTSKKIFGLARGVTINNCIRLSGGADTSVGNSIFALILIFVAFENISDKSLVNLHQFMTVDLKDLGFTFTGGIVHNLCDTTFLRHTTVRVGNEYKMVPTLGLLLKPMLKLKNYKVFDEDQNMAKNVFYYNYFLSFEKVVLPEPFENIKHDVLRTEFKRVPLDEDYEYSLLSWEAAHVYPKSYYDRYEYTSDFIAVLINCLRDAHTTVIANDMSDRILRNIMRKDYSIQPYKVRSLDAHTGSLSSSSALALASA